MQQNINVRYIERDRYFFCLFTSQPLNSYVTCICVALLFSKKLHIIWDLEKNHDKHFIFSISITVR